MPETLKNCTFIMACREFFGLKSGQTLQDFAKEVRDMPTKDRQDLSRCLKRLGTTLPRLSNHN